MKWNEFAEIYLKHCQLYKRPRTYRNFELPAVNSFKSSLDVAAITPLDIEAWTQWLKADGYGPSTIAIMWRSLRVAFGYAVKLRVIDRNPFDGLRRPEDVSAGRYLIDGEVALLKDHAPEPLRKTMIFALATGFRLGEVLALDWSMVRDGVVYFPKEKRKNKRKNTRIPLNAEALEAMGPVQESGRVFATNPTTIQHQLRKLALRHTLGRVRFHDFRHTFVTNFLQHGSPLDLIEAGTHSSENSLKGYHHPPTQHLRDKFGGVRAAVEATTHTPAYWSSQTYALDNLAEGSNSTIKALRGGGLEPPRPFGHTHLKRKKKMVVLWDGVIEVEE